jgi:hypothetical protein
MNIFYPKMLFTYPYAFIKDVQATGYRKPSSLKRRAIITTKLEISSGFKFL